MRFFVTVLFLPIIILGSAHAGNSQHIALDTSSGKVQVEGFAGNTKQRPAVLILSGSKGFNASVYDEIARTFHVAGLDTYLVHVLSPTDQDAILSAGSASTRIDYYAKRRPDWIAAVRGVISYFNRQPRYAGRVGLLGISFGAQTAIVASSGQSDIGALVLVDGGLPNGYSQPIQSLPPTHLIWGSADRVFPLNAGKKLRDLAQSTGSPASLAIFEGGTHDFFLKSGTSQARAAHENAARFLAAQLSR
ncbi:dienelactone hydrolase family protein [Phyllobacterium leguminum]|uniref:Dienelactone hydrolase n=1 Tax=Phyllobacterium leguminum TaxID=314237 RepID=A0A318T1Z0_9HYPH|nr:dienelactone hydrolase family protein [Phyllobacterium leguminum]PYE87846.1 dienelactone hydrolase [Phyllobacterium leguminum]